MMVCVVIQIVCGMTSRGVCAFVNQSVVPPALCHIPPDPSYGTPVDYDIQLSFCVESTNNSCCLTIHEMMLKSSMSTMLSILGHGACYNYLRELECSWLCSSCSRGSTEWTAPTVTSSPWSVIVYVTNSFARQMMSACADQCYSSFAGGSPTTIGESVAGSASAFMTLFEMPMSTSAPNISFRVGFSRALMSYNGSGQSNLKVPGVDDVGCDSSCAQGTQKAYRSLTWCTEYSYPSASCCYEYTDKALATEVGARAANVYGNDCCYSNIRKMYCSWLCAPDNVDFVVWTGRAGAATATIYVSNHTATALWISCSRHPNLYKVDACVEAGQMHPTPSMLLETLNTQNYATYKPGPGKPTIIFVIGTNPNTMNSLSIPMLNACLADLQGCQTNTTEHRDQAPNDVSVIVSVLVVTVVGITLVTIGAIVIIAVVTRNLYIAKQKAMDLTANSTIVMSQTQQSVIPLYSINSSETVPRLTMSGTFEINVRALPLFYPSSIPDTGHTVATIQHGTSSSSLIPNTNNL